MGPEVSGEGGGKTDGKESLCVPGVGVGPTLSFRVIQCAHEKEFSRPPSGSRS